MPLSAHTHTYTLAFNFWLSVLPSAFPLHPAHHISCQRQQKKKKVQRDYFAIQTPRVRCIHMSRRLSKAAFHLTFHERLCAIKRRNVSFRFSCGSFCRRSVIWFCRSTQHILHLRSNLININPLTQTESFMHSRTTSPPGF